MIRKIVIAVPVLTLVILGGIIIWVNTADSAEPVVQEEPSVREDEKLEMTKHNVTNPKNKYNQKSESSFDGTVEGFITEVYREWHELNEEQRYDFAHDTASYDLVLPVTSEINFLEPQIPSEWMWKFDALQKSAHQLTSPVFELEEQEREELIAQFEKDLSRLYEKFVLQS